MVATHLTHLYSSTPFDLPSNLFAIAALILVIGYLVPPIVSIGWALWKWQQVRPLPLRVRPFSRAVPNLRRGKRRTDRAA